MRRICRGLCLAFAGTAMLLQGAAAQDTQSVNGLLAKGYEIRSVMMLPMDAAKRVAGDASSDTVVVTLQGGKSVAVCFLALPNWVALNKASLDNPALCEVR